MSIEARRRVAPTEQGAYEFQRESLQRHAIDFGEWISRESHRRAQDLGHTALRPAYGRLMVFLDWEGSRITDLARALDVSKNAVSQLVTELEELGYLERVSDPADARAKIVRYTKRGKALIADARAIGERLDAEIEDIIGGERFAELQDILRDIARHLTSRGGRPSRTT